MQKVKKNNTVRERDETHTISNESLLSCSPTVTLDGPHTLHHTTISHNQPVSSNISHNNFNKHMFANR